MKEKDKDQIIKMTERQKIGFVTVLAVGITTCIALMQTVADIHQTVNTKFGGWEAHLKSLFNIP